MNLVIRRIISMKISFKELLMYSLEADYLNPNTFLQLFKKYGVTMYPENIGELLHLRKDTLRVEASQTRIVQLKSPDQ